MNRLRFLMMLLAAIFTLAVPTLVPAQGGPAAVREQLQQAISRGDVAGALALFADDAVIDQMSGTGVCVAAPCVGKVAIQKDMERRVTAKNQPKTLNHYVSGNVLTTRVAVESDVIRKAGAERAILWLVYEVKDGKIVSELGPLWERTDPQTARFLEWLRAQQPAR